MQIAPKSTSANENPGALAGATGAEVNETLVNSLCEYSPKQGRSAISEYASADHKAMARQLGYALTLGDEPAWTIFTVAVRRRLSVAERVSLAWAAMMALDEDEAEAVADTVLSVAGAPLPPFGDIVEDARWWASGASEDECRAYALASFERMSKHDRADFADFAKGAA